MEEVVSKPMRSLKVSIMSLLIVASCGAIAYNVLLQQSPKRMLPGATAVRVQVDDIDVSEVSPQNDTSSIGRLLKRTTNAAGPAQNSVLTASVQGQLAHLGYYNGSVDGHSGPQTLAAIKQYQQQNALRQTGQVSRKLLDHLKFTRKITDASNNTGSINTGAAPQQNVLHVQKKLTEFGYLPGEVDGVFGSSTSTAIRQFEADRSLPVTGQITAGLLQELGL